MESAIAINYHQFVKIIIYFSLLDTELWKY